MEQETKYPGWAVLTSAIIAGLAVWFLTAPLRVNLPVSNKTEQLRKAIKTKNDSITGEIKSASEISKNSVEKSKEIIKKLSVEKPVIRDTTNEYMKEYLRNYKPE